MTKQTRRASRGKSADQRAPIPFAEIMREQAMVTPSELERSVREAIGERENASADDLLRAGEKILDRVLDGDCEGRESALDLLTVDALVTRALEIAARDPKSLAEFPEVAMKRISAR